VSDTRAMKYVGIRGGYQTVSAKKLNYHTNKKHKLRASGAVQNCGAPSLPDGYTSLFSILALL